MELLLLYRIISISVELTALLYILLRSFRDINMLLYEEVQGAGLIAGSSFSLYLEVFAKSTRGIMRGMKQMSLVFFYLEVLAALYFERDY